MSDPIWDEKPPIMAQPEGSTVWLCNPKFLDWLVKLKVEYDLRGEHSGRWLHFVAVDYPEIKESLSPQKLMELKEKAEKWDETQEHVIQIALDLNIPPKEIKRMGHSSMAISTALNWKNKLDAVKKWFIEYADTKIEKFDHPWRKLEKILEGEG